MVKLTVERIALGKAVLNLLPRQLISCSKTAFRSSLLLEVVRVTIGELPSLLKSVVSFNNDECDGNENAKKAMGLLSKTTTLHVHHAFLYISSPSLHHYNVKMPDFTLCGGRKQTTTNFSFSF